METCAVRARVTHSDGLDLDQDHTDAESLDRGGGHLQCRVCHQMLESCGACKLAIWSTGVP